MRKLWLIGTAVFGAISVLADGRDGLAHWWKVEDLNRDGFLQAEEVYDVMTRGADAPLVGEYVYQSLNEEKGAKPVKIVNGDVFKSNMNKTVVEDAIRFNNPTNYSADGTLRINYQSLRLPKAASVGSGEATVVARIKWDGARFTYGGNYNYNINLYANNFDDNKKNRIGWRMGLRCYSSGTSGSFHPMLTYGNQEIGFHYGKFADTVAAKSYLVKADCWYDLAITFKTGVVDGVTYIYASGLYRRGEKSHAYRRHTYFELPPTVLAPTWTAVYEPGTIHSHIGFHGGAAGGVGGYDYFVDAGKDDAFTGFVHELKVYDRHMSEREMLQCFADDDPIFTIGSRNDSADEFSDENPAEVFEPATMPWVKMRKTLNAGNKSASIRASIDASMLNIPRLVEVKFLKEGAFAGERVRLDMNGDKIGRFTVPADGTVRFFVPASRFSALVRDETQKSYSALFTIRREDEMASDIRFDFVSIDGGWQLGENDNTSNEFAGEDGGYWNYVYDVSQKNLKKIHTSLYTSIEAYRDLDLHFAVGDFLANKCDYKFTLKSRNGQLATMSFFINDMNASFADLGVGELNKSKTWIIPAGTFTSGGNHIRIRNTDSELFWLTLDYIRLEPVVPQLWRNNDDGLHLLVR